MSQVTRRSASGVRSLQSGIAIDGHDQVRFGEQRSQHVDHAFIAADGQAVRV